MDIAGYHEDTFIITTHFYIYKVKTLEKFVDLKQSPNEISLKLEQLRALDNNIKIDVIFANSTPVGVDTNEDFLEIKKLMEYKS